MFENTPEMVSDLLKIFLGSMPPEIPLACCVACSTQLHLCPRPPLCNCPQVGLHSVRYRIMDTGTCTCSHVEANACLAISARWRLQFRAMACLDRPALIFQCWWKWDAFVPSSRQAKWCQGHETCLLCYLRCQNPSYGYVLCKCRRTCHPSIDHFQAQEFAQMLDCRWSAWHNVWP